MGVSCFVILKSVKMSMHTYAPQTSREQTYIDGMSRRLQGWLPDNCVFLFAAGTLKYERLKELNFILTFRFFFFLVEIYNIVCRVITIVVVIIWKRIPSVQNIWYVQRINIIYRCTYIILMRWYNAIKHVQYKNRILYYAAPPK